MISETVSSRRNGSERAVAEDVVGDLARDLGALLTRQRRLVERDRLLDGLQHARLDAGVAPLVATGGEQARAEPRDDVMVDARLEVGERIVGPAVAPARRAARA